MENEPVKIKPVPDTLSIFRKILTYVPGFCKYCGKKFTPCHSKEFNILIPTPQNGKCCPEGHIRYVKEFLGHSVQEKWFDNVKTT